MIWRAVRRIRAGTQIIRRRGMNLVFNVGRELAPWRHEPVVQYVHDRLHDLMASP